MTTFSSLTRPLLLHSLAAAMLCPIALAKPKPVPSQPAQTTKKQVVPTKKPAGPAAPSPAAVKKATAAKKPATQQEGERHAAAPVKPAPERRVAYIPDSAELLTRVPASGPLGLEDLLLLAIANNPQLERRRADIATARAHKRAVQDFKNPEIRVSYASQDDNYIRRPYTETTIENYSATESFNGTDTTTFRDPATGELGESTADINMGTTTTYRYREIERIVTPRGNGEDITTNIYEGRVENTDGLRNRTDADGQRQDAQTENIFRKLESINHERMTSTAANGPNESVNVRLRFQIPHLWQRKARIAEAAAEIVLAEAQYLSDEDKLVRDVRDSFQMLGVLESTLSAQQKRRESFTTFRSEMDALNFPEFAMDVARARFDMIGSITDIRKVESEMDRTRTELAWRCGLRQPSRIRSGGLITRRIVDLPALDPAYLVDIAMLYRSDVLESHARLEIARALLAEARAAKIPFASFADIAYSRETDDGRSGAQSEWSVQLGIDLPIFDWFRINKRSKEFKKAEEAWQRQTERQQQRVRVEVELAIDALRRAAARMRRYEGDMLEAQRQAKADVENVKVSGMGLAGISRGKRAEYEYEDRVQELQIGRYAAYSDYNRALMALEGAIGVRIEKALNGWRRDR